MPPQTDSQRTTPPAAEPTELKAAVTVEKKGMSILQWVGVVGVGSALIVYVVPRIMRQDAANQMFIQTKMFDTVAESSAALVKAADSMDRMADKIGDLNDSHEDLLQALKPLTQKLGEVATAVNEQVEQEAAP